MKGKEKAACTMELLGCSMDFFKAWLTYCFVDGMSFQNYGPTWHIDHTVPCCKFDLTNPAEQRKCFHWSNMKPMFAKENISKNGTASADEIKAHESNLAEFMEDVAHEFEDDFTTVDIDRLCYISS